METKLGRRASLAALAGLTFAPVARAAPSKAMESMPLPEVVIYHLEGRRSERLVWLMEELDLPYKLIFKRGDLGGSMALIREVSPLVPMAPTVKYGDQILVESGAIIELILNRHARGKLQPARDSADYPRHLLWMHFAEGSLAARLFSDYRAWNIQPPAARSPLVDSEAVMEFAETHLRSHPWFGGAQFSAADIMMKFPVDVGLRLNLVERSDYPRLAEWTSKIEARPAHQRMRATALPDGMIGALRPLEKHAPSGPRAPRPQR